MKISIVNSLRNGRSWSVYYDGECGFCDRVKRWLSRIDFFDAIEWIPYQALERLPPGLSLDDLERAVYLDTGQGRLYEGFYAFKMLTWKLPPLIPLVPIMWFPGMNLMGKAVYSWVARDRHRFSGCRKVSE